MPIRIALLALAAALLFAVRAESTSLPERTFTVSLGVNGAAADGGSTRPAVSVSGGFVAFESTATNLALDPNGAVSDVFARDVVGGATRLISEGLGDAGADGPSGNAAVGGRVVAFHSEATNLVEGDRNGVRDVFARSGTDPIVRVSQPPGGGEADGPSGEPDVSDDGRYVAFTSSATNLVEDDRNGVSDVFVRDLRTGRITRLSEPSDGPSRAPAISANGRYVSFYSVAERLVPGDRNGVGDVYLADLRSGSLKLVTRGLGGRQQNAAVLEPFPQISDVSRDGRYVAFDSDATNLVRGDRNRDTDVFVRDMKRGRTTRVSVGPLGREGDNDSFFPTMTADGRFVAFQSFASNIAPGGGPREDVFLVDRRRGLPTVISVGDRGQRRQAESVRQLLQRPAVNGDGQVVAFTSTAGNLTPDDAPGFEDVFLRVTAAPRLRSIRRPRRVERTRRPRVRVSVDDPRARSLLCTVDGKFVPCRNGGRLPRLAPGRHVLRVLAGGPGMLYDGRIRTRRFVVR